MTPVVRTTAVLLSALLALLPGCSHDDGIAGGGTDSPNSIAGVLINPATGAPVGDARVLLTRTPSGTPEWPVTGAPRGYAVLVDSARTAPNGRFEFVVATPGAYDIYARSPDSTLVARIPVEVDTSDILLVPDTMSRPAGISGTVRAPAGYPAVAALLGTPYSAIADTAGRYRLGGIAEGVYRLGLVIDNPSVGILGTVCVETVTVTAGEDIARVTVDSVPVGGVEGQVVDLAGFASANPFNVYGGIWWFSANDSVRVLDNEIDSVGDSAVSWAAHLRYVVTGRGPSVYMATNLGRDHAPWHCKDVRDMSGADSVTLMVRGNGCHMRLFFHSALVQNWNNLYFDMPVVPTQWTRIVVRLPADLVYLTDIYQHQSWTYLSQALQSVWVSNEGGVVGDTADVWVGSMVFHF